MTMGHIKIIDTPRRYAIAETTGVLKDNWCQLFVRATRALISIFWPHVYIFQNQSGCLCLYK